MHRKKGQNIFILLFILIMTSTGASAFNISLDSLIKFHGYVLDTISDSPNKLPVGAKMVLERLPYGSEIGIISSNDSSGYFEYYLSLDHDYRLDIKSDGHKTHFETVSPKQWAQNGALRVDYYLMPEWREEQVIRLKKLIFEQGRSVILPESVSELDLISKAMVNNPSMVIQLEGHTDWRGDHKSNLKLSEERVNAVKSYLTAKGITSKRIKTKAFGGTEPLTRNASIEASSINRRVEVRILKID